MRRSIAALALGLFLLAPARAWSADLGCLTSGARELLAEIESRFGAVRVSSTCRPGAVVAGTRRPSPHRYGIAFDFYPAPGRQRAVIAWLKAAHRGGVGTYSGRKHHVHADVGGVRTWHEHVGGKRKARHKQRRRAWR